MKKIYEEPSFNVQEVIVEDIVTTSGDNWETDEY